MSTSSQMGLGEIYGSQNEKGGEEMSDTQRSIKTVLGRLDGVKQVGKGWVACCPAHDDVKPSLSINQGDDGRMLLYCHAGCTAGDICDSIGLELSDLFDNENINNSVKIKPVENKPKVWDSPEQFISVFKNTLNSNSINQWKYENKFGNEILRIIRFNIQGGKTFRPIFPIYKLNNKENNNNFNISNLIQKHGNTEGNNRLDVNLINSENNIQEIKCEIIGWQIGDPQGLLPLYKLPEIKHKNRIYLFEGEKAADAAREIGLSATTSAHGAKSANKTDWEPLSDKEIIIFPDNDDAGRKYAHDVMELLGELKDIPKIKIVEIPDMPEKSDIYDFIELCRVGEVSDENIKQAIENLASEAKWCEIEAKQDTSGDGIAFKPMPLDVLPSVLGDFIQCASDAIGCDPAYIGVPMLSSLASSIGTKMRLELKQGWTEPAILWSAVVGHSGTQKSPALELAVLPVRRREQEAMQVYLAECDSYEQAKLCYERDLAVWKRSKDGGDPPAKPEEPIAERFICGDVTVESLAPLLQNNPQGMLVMRDELSGWIGSFDRYSSGKGADASQWLEMYGGRSFTIDRKTGTPKTIFVKHAAASVTGGIQPETLRDSLGESLIHNGMVARLFFTMPPTRERAWSDRCVTDEMKANVQCLFNLLYNLPHEVGIDGELQAGIVRMTDEAKCAWGEFFNEHQKERRGLPSALAAAWSKLEGGTARLALVIHLARWAAGEITADAMYELDERSMNAAIKLSRWFMNEAKRVYALLTTKKMSSKQQSRIELVRSKGGKVTVREWQRSRSIKTSAAARAELDEMVSAGDGQWVDVNSGSKGGARTRKFVLN
ncbi:DUF3987 domain-containing protein [Planctomycetota bacterium]|nr:DUF3987 domain-containing protein [Planctomycetota bacterium]